MLNINYEKLESETKFVIVNIISTIFFLFILLYLDYPVFIKTATSCLCTETFLLISILFVASMFYFFYLFGLVLIIYVLKRFLTKEEYNFPEMNLVSSVLLWIFLILSIIISLLTNSAVRYDFITLVLFPLIFFVLSFMRLRRKFKTN